MGALDVNVAHFAHLVAELPIGKRLPDAVYLHEAALERVSDALRDIVDRARDSAQMNGDWNVVKFAAAEARLSFLWYPRFFEEGFPALAASTVVDLSSGEITRRVYGQENPPILHRKEAMLPGDHPAAPEAAALTRAAEAFGLFSDTHSIGQKQRWQARLDSLGLKVNGHHIESVCPGEQVARHRTALTRYGLSTPMQALWRHGFLDGGSTVFDYGCGRGDDLRALKARGLDCAGWDPYFAPHEPRRPADVVNLGFVLNVIEDQEERTSALQAAWALAGRLLVVGVLIGGRSAYERCRLFRDGVLTARGTFQKYFASGEFREYLEATLGREPIVLAPGIAFVFRNDADEQAFLARRSRTRTTAPPPIRPRADRPVVPRPPRQARARAPSKWEAHAELVDAFWTACITLGRIPEADEFASLGELRSVLGLPTTVLRALLKQRGTEAMGAAEAARREDLLVFLALNVFERRRSFGALPEVVQRDVKALFGSYVAAQTEAQALLFSTGRVETIREAATISASRGIGYLDGDHSLQLHTSLARDLPPVLRVYLGCAARLYGDVETADLVKVHIQSGKVSLMSYEDFDRPIPLLMERVKINLRRQQIDFFEYGSSELPSQPLYLKARYMGPNLPHFEEQLAFDKQLSSIQGLDLSGFGPSVPTLEAILASAGVRMDGYTLVPQVPQVGSRGE